MATNEADPAGSYNPLSDPEERRVLSAALDSFRQYRQAAHYNITHLRRQAFYSLPSSHIDILSGAPFSLPSTFAAVDEAIDANADIAESILKVGLPAFGLAPNDQAWKGQATPNDMDKARSTIRQIFRDWSDGGIHERQAAYTPLLSALSEHLKVDSLSKRHQYKVLVPGAGLGRLVLEICAAGYQVEGNEISYHQLLASNYMLNHTAEAGQHQLYPWALSFSNHLTRKNQLRYFSVPDIQPATYLDESEARTRSELHYSMRMSMTAGDFCQLYKQPEYESGFHAVTTCFFVDTAPNVISYILTVKHCLVRGGIWTNVGPLLWHFESGPTPAELEKRRHGNKSHGNKGSMSSSQPMLKPNDEGIGEPGSFELSNDEVLALLKHFDFDILEQRQLLDDATGYIQDQNSMLQNVYQPAFWTARKR